jgi:hypothetical protein
LASKPPIEGFLPITHQHWTNKKLLLKSLLGYIYLAKQTSSKLFCRNAQLRNKFAIFIFIGKQVLNSTETMSILVC